MHNNLLKQAYSHCQKMARSHYENFPVASRFLPKSVREPISVVYTFARNADDFADEGNLSMSQRISRLDNYVNELQKIERNEASNDLVFIALKDVIQQFTIPVSLFYDLLQAFKLDVTQSRYQTFAELLDYCRLSANPVGRILLYMHNSATNKNLFYSDAICSGLQLINFYQDIAQDLDENGRVYIPVEDLQRFQVTATDFANKTNNNRTRSLMEFQLHRANQLYRQGKPLCRSISGRFGFEIRLIYAGGNTILHKLSHCTDNIYARPRLNRKDKWLIIRDALFKC
jgi:squalene synthase HpnC